MTATDAPPLRWRAILVPAAGHGLGSAVVWIVGVAPIAALNSGAPGPIVISALVAAAIGLAAGGAAGLVEAWALQRGTSAPRAGAVASALVAAAVLLLLLQLVYLTGSTGGGMEAGLSALSGVANVAGSREGPMVLGAFAGAHAALGLTYGQLVTSRLDARPLAAQTSVGLRWTAGGGLLLLIAVGVGGAALLPPRAEPLAEGGPFGVAYAFGVFLALALLVPGLPLAVTLPFALERADALAWPRAGEPVAPVSAGAAHLRRAPGVK